MTNPADELKFGAVIVTSGKHEGKLGYFDDLDEKDRAIVYFGLPFASEPVVIGPSNLRNITSIEHERFKKENPDFCRFLGID